MYVHRSMHFTLPLLSLLSRLMFNILIVLVFYVLLDFKFHYPIVHTFTSSLAVETYCRVNLVNLIYFY
ncbi:hypothetical protein KSF78_0008968 [Schistosoma japonicum]|nr:hypothetical protein KSF78_0008968 [Schistosoma japonicum]